VARANPAAAAAAARRRQHPAAAAAHARHRGRPRRRDGGARGAAAVVGGLAGDAADALGELPHLRPGDGRAGGFRRDMGGRARRVQGKVTARTGRWGVGIGAEGWWW
jgi:hypothetical protein